MPVDLDRASFGVVSGGASKLGPRTGTCCKDESDESTKEFVNYAFQTSKETFSYRTDVR